MRIHVAIALAAMSSIATADTRTFICTDATGSKSIQDRPCPAGAQVEQRTAKSNPVTMDQWIDGLHRKGREARCKIYSDGVEHQRSHLDSGDTPRQLARNKDAYLAAKKHYKRTCP